MEEVGLIEREYKNVLYKTDPRTIRDHAIVFGTFVATRELEEGSRAYDACKMTTALRAARFNFDSGRDKPVVC